MVSKQIEVLVASEEQKMRDIDREREGGGGDGGHRRERNPVEVCLSLGGFNNHNVGRSTSKETRGVLPIDRDV